LISEFCVWIDPIDNTKGFINGTLDCVTILIGLSRNKRSYIGVTAIPFLKENEKIVYKPEILLGIAPIYKAFSSF
jgi:3'-phosphoadenosine 5'-phosphosulfate (PAPS) 3'-phosphatase